MSLEYEPALELLHISAKYLFLKLGVYKLMRRPADIPTLQGYLAHEDPPPPKEPSSGPRHRPTAGSYGGLFLMSEVSLAGFRPAVDSSLIGFTSCIVTVLKVL